MVALKKMNLRCVKIEDIKYPRNKITFRMIVMVLQNLMPTKIYALWNVCTLSEIRFDCVSSLQAAASHSNSSKYNKLETFATNAFWFLMKSCSWRRTPISRCPEVEKLPMWFISYELYDSLYHMDHTVYDSYGKKIRWQIRRRL